MSSETVSTFDIFYSPPFFLGGGDEGVSAPSGPASMHYTNFRSACKISSRSVAGWEIRLPEKMFLNHTGKIQ